ncbi:MAG: HAMP domain-containing protein [Betaproteobacteria bacterium]|nr:HAMP domain-containing protein [Betaproteobacteria bacterium]
MNLSNLKIGTKLMLGFASVLALTTLLGVMALLQLSNLSVKTERIATNNLPSVQFTADLNNLLGAIRRAEAMHLLTSDPAVKKVQEKLIADARKSVDAIVARAGSVLDSEVESKAIANFQKHFAEWSAADAKMLELSGVNNATMAEEMFRDQVGKAFDAAMKELEAVAAFNAKEGEEAWSETQAVVSSGRITVISAMVAALVIGALLAILISRAITTPVGEAVKAAQEMSTGDMTRALVSQGKDEIAVLLQSLESMRQSLSRVVQTVRQGSESVETASSEIAQGNHDLSARTEQQASSLEETAASMEQLSAQVKHNAENALQANQLAASASNVAARGGDVVGRVVDTMKEINDSSRRISDIIAVIDGIAFQTNILALNAAVEAARAGEQGRGFAVVASEVRALAGRSAEAAKEIKSLINASVERVEQGSALVNEAGSTMAEVVTSIRRVTDMMGEISSASNEQSLGVAQVGEAVTHMDRATQQNAALVEQIAAAASSLKTQSAELVSTVSIFKLDGAQSARKVQVRAPESAQKPFAGEERRAIPAKPASKPTPAAAPKVAQALPKPAAPAPAPAKTFTAKAGGDDDWETF